MAVYLFPPAMLAIAWLAQVRRNGWIDRGVLAATASMVILIAGLRSYADVDYPAYVQMFYANPTLATWSLADLGRLYPEPGYVLLMALFKSLETGFGPFVLVCVAVSVTAKSAVVSRFSPHASFALCLYLCIHFQTIEFIQLRWAMATGLILLAFWQQYSRAYAKCALCFAAALMLHSYSIVFILVALVLPLFRAPKLLFFLVPVSMAFGLLFRNDMIAPYVLGGVEGAMLTRISSYAMSVADPLGLFSYGKLLLYVVIAAACMTLKEESAWREDPRNQFLFRLSMLSICLTLALSWHPVLHYRAAVIADLTGITLALNALSSTLERNTRATAFAVLMAMYGTWYARDLRNNVAGDRIYEYKTWIGDGG